MKQHTRVLEESRKIGSILLRLIYDYSGAASIASKFRFKDPSEKSPPSGPLWLIAIYIALYGIAHQLHQSAISDNNQRWSTYQPIEISSGAVLQVELETDKSKLTEELSRCESHLLNFNSLRGVAPVRPNLTNPLSVIEAVFFKPIVVYQTTADWHESLPVRAAKDYAWAIRWSTNDVCFDEALDDEGMSILSKSDGDPIIRDALQYTHGIPHELNWREATREKDRCASITLLNMYTRLQLRLLELETDEFLERVPD